jgi:hypothetical protein
MNRLKSNFLSSDQVIFDFRFSIFASETIQNRN